MKNPKKLRKWLLAFEFIVAAGIVCYCCCGCKKDKDDEIVCKDIEGNTYKTVKIGEQVWMAEDLRVTKFNDGTSLYKYEYEGATYGFADTSDPKHQYGSFVVGDFTAYGHPTYYDVSAAKWAIYKYGKSRALCPEGWHIPTSAECSELISYLQRTYDDDLIQGRNTVARLIAVPEGFWRGSSNIKAIGNPDSDMQNITGLSINSTGRAGARQIVGAGMGGGFWTGKGVFSIDYDFPDAIESEGYSPSTDGFPVRCIKD